MRRAFTAMAGGSSCPASVNCTNSWQLECGGQVGWLACVHGRQLHDMAHAAVRLGGFHSTRKQKTSNCVRFFITRRQVLSSVNGTDSLEVTWGARQVKRARPVSMPSASVHKLLPTRAERTLHSTSQT